MCSLLFAVPSSYLALFFLPLSARPNVETLCSRSHKASTSVWSRRQAAQREERSIHAPNLSHSSPGAMSIVPAEALASFSDTQGYLTREGHKGGGTVASLRSRGKTIPAPRCPAHGSGLHQAAILPYKLCFSCNTYHTLQQTPASATSHTTSAPWRLAPKW